MKRTVRNCLITCAVILLILLVLTVLEIRCFGCLPHITRAGAEHMQGGNLHVCVNNFPDKAFRRFLRDNYCTDGRNTLSHDQIDAITQMDCSGIGAKSLKGIEHFTSLEKLNCADNQLEELDPKKLALLTDLDCSNNRIETLSLYYNTRIQFLNCERNQLTNLNIHNQRNLAGIDCSHNRLSESLLFSELGPALKKLDCSYNSFSNLRLQDLFPLRNFTISPQNATMSYRSDLGVAPSSFANSKNQILSAVTFDGIHIFPNDRQRYHPPKGYNDSILWTIQVQVGSRTTEMQVYSTMECSHQYDYRIFIPAKCKHCGETMHIRLVWWFRLCLWASCVMILGAVIYLRHRKAKGKGWDVVPNVPDRETYVN